MKNNNLLNLGILGILGYLLYTNLSKSSATFYKLPDGTLIPVSEATSRLPALGYFQTVYGWVHTSVLQTVQTATPNSGNSVIEFVDLLPDLYQQGEAFYSMIKDLFKGNEEELNGLILGDPGGDFSDFA